MSYTLVNRNYLARNFPDMADKLFALPCITADLPNGLDGGFYDYKGQHDKIHRLYEELSEVYKRLSEYEEFSVGDEVFCDTVMLKGHAVVVKYLPDLHSCNLLFKDGTVTVVSQKFLKKTGKHLDLIDELFSQISDQTEGSAYDKCPICVNRNKNCQFGTPECHFSEEREEESNEI